MPSLISSRRTLAHGAYKGKDDKTSGLPLLQVLDFVSFHLISPIDSQLRRRESQKSNRQFVWVAKRALRFGRSHISSLTCIEFTFLLRCKNPKHYGPSSILQKKDEALKMQLNKSKNDFCAFTNYDRCIHVCSIYFQRMSENVFPQLVTISET